MAALQSMTLTERMNTINSDGVHEYTFQEACNRYLKLAGTINTGNELITAVQDQSFASSGTGNWVAFNPGSGSASLSRLGTGKLELTTTTAVEVEGAELPAASIDGDGGAYPIVAGRTYYVSMALSVDAGSPALSVQLGNATSGN